MAMQLPEIGVVNWDFTVDHNNNPVLIEANIGGGSIWLTQMANGRLADGPSYGHQRAQGDDRHTTCCSIIQLKQ